MTPPYNILHIFGRMTRGGAETRTVEVMRHADPGRFRLHFLALSGLPGELDEEIRSLGGEVHPLKLGASFPRKLGRLLREHQVHAVHSHVHYPSGFFLRLAAKAGVPVRITHFRCSDDGRGQSLRRRLQRRILSRWIDRYSTDILSVSRAAMEASWGARWESDPRCRVLYNGIDPRAFAAPPDREGVRRDLGMPADARLFVHVGRLEPVKNQMKVAGIFAELCRLDAAAWLLLVGQGGTEYEGQVRRRLAESGVIARAVFAGVRPDVPRLLKASDAMIFPSLNEGLPGAVLEACAAGTPVLASSIPAVAEVAGHLPASGPRSIPLSEPDESWARAAAALAADGARPGVRERAAELFSRSIFDLGQCVRAHEAVWAGAAAGDPAADHAGDAGVAEAPLGAGLRPGMSRSSARRIAPDDGRSTHAWTR